MNLLIIRPQPGARATARRAEAIRLKPLVMPLFEVQSVQWQTLGAENYDALLITSANAIRYGGDGLEALRSLPVYAVGETSAKAARAAGFVIAATGNTDAAAMLATAQKNGQKRLLWLTGADHIDLRPPHTTHIDRCTVYEANKLPAPDGFAELLSVSSVVMLHSPRAARHFAALCDKGRIDRARITLAALSGNIAKAAGKGWKNKIIADQPSDAALLALLATYFTNAPHAP